MLILSTSLAYSQDLFMYGENGTKIYFNKMDSIVIVKFKKNTSSKDKIEVLAKINPTFRIYSFNIDRYVIPINAENRIDFDFLNKKEFIVYANQSLTRGDGEIEIPTDKILVQIKSGIFLDNVLKDLNINYIITSN